MKEHKPYSAFEEEDDNVLALHEPVAACTYEAVAMPDDVAYANIVDGALQVTPDIEEEIAATDRGETVAMDEFKTIFSRWIDK